MRENIKGKDKEGNESVEIQPALREVAVACLKIAVVKILRISVVLTKKVMSRITNSRIRRINFVNNISSRILHET